MKFLNILAGNRRKVPNFGSKMRKNAKIALKKRIFMNIGCVALATALCSAQNWLHFVSVALNSHFRSYFGNFKNLPRAPQKWQNSTLKFFSCQQASIVFKSSKKPIVNQIFGLGMAFCR